MCDLSLGLPLPDVFVGCVDVDGGCDDGDLHLDCCRCSKNGVITCEVRRSLGRVEIGASAPDLNIETEKE